MPVKVVRKHMQGYQPIIEADEGYLVGGRTVDSGPVFDTLFQALSYMAVVIDENVKAGRKVRLGKVVPFDGIASCAVPPSEP